MHMNLYDLKSLLVESLFNVVANRVVLYAFFGVYLYYSIIDVVFLGFGTWGRGSVLEGVKDFYKAS